MDGDLGLHRRQNTHGFHLRPGANELGAAHGGPPKGRAPTASFPEDRSLISRTGRGGSDTFWNNFQQDRFGREGVLKR